MIPKIQIHYKASQKHFRFSKIHTETFIIDKMSQRHT